MDPVALGPFLLSRRVGVGGMGEVWEGQHPQQAVPVAVKVITAGRARDEHYREAFLNEVRAVAGLDHPGIVMVFDTGTVTAEAHAAAAGRLVEGSPYLAMEYATAGSLGDRDGVDSWAELRFVLLSLLDALAHAHARGVIHRDLKPGNVLLFEDGAQEDPSLLGVRMGLTDFGLAHAQDRYEVRDRVAGTPGYMAPEQFRGRWRDFGPWTDLYALGCLAWVLATGRRPFSGREYTQQRQAHLGADPPPLVPRVAVPEGFEAWALRLLEKDVCQRFQRAADAAWALIQLGEPDPDAVSAGASGPLGSRHTLVPTEKTLVPSALSWLGSQPTAVPVDPSSYQELAEGDELGPLHLSEATPTLARRALPPLPPTWRPPGARAHDLRLVGAGLGLYGLRTIPLVGRERERTLAWAALSRVRSQGGARVVLLRGPAGTGKSRLAQWLSERAHEVGNAVALRAVHNAAAGPADGVGPMVTRALGCVGLSRAEAVARVSRWMRERGVVDDYEWHAVVQLMRPASGTDLRHGARTVHFDSAEERYALVHRLVEHLAAGLDDDSRRPAVLWLDDVQWGADALGLARYLLTRAHRRPVPVLVLLTARDESLERRPEEREALDSLMELPGTREVVVGPLGLVERAALVEELLGLEGELAAQVEERTGGNPLFAVQLVGDWVQRGVLVPRPTGFALREGERAELPDDIHALWRVRVGQVLAGAGAEARTALFLAALLGSDVSRPEWEGALAVAGVPEPRDLVATLLQRSLVRATDDGWSFSHAMLRESLVRSARESGRDRELHRACATMLRTRYVATTQRGVSERLGRHLVWADALEEALDPLLEGAREARAISDYIAAIRLLDLRDEVADRLGLGPADVRRLDGQLLRVELLIGRSRYAEAREVGRRAAAAARRAGSRSRLAEALRGQGLAAGKGGDHDAWLDLVSQGLAAAREAGDGVAEARCLVGLGNAANARGDLRERARAALHEGLELAREHGQIRVQADALLGLASCHRAEGDLDSAVATAMEARSLYAQLGTRFGVAAAEIFLGEAHRYRDELEPAERAYRNAIEHLEALGSSDSLVPEINFGLVLLARGEYARARVVYDRVIDAASEVGKRVVEAIAHVMALPCTVDPGDWAAWRRHMDAARAVLEGSRVVDKDIAFAWQLAAELAAGAEEPDRAREAYLMALAQWEGLGEEERVEAVHSALATLEPSTWGGWWTGP